MLSRTRRTPSLSRRLAVLIACLGACALIAAGTGMGATSGSETVGTNLIGSLSMSDPVAAPANPVCTRAVAATDTDGCADVAYAGGAEHVLNLGSLSATDVQAGSLTWNVTTTNPTGYTVRMANSGAAPMLHGSAGNIPDYPTTPVAASTAIGTTGFGVAIGDPASAQGSVGFPTSPWVSGGQQGMLFAGIPTTGITVAQRSSAVANDPFTATFAASSVAASRPAAGSYSGTVSVVASAI